MSIHTRLNDSTNGTSTIGHTAKDCKEPRKFDLDNIPDKLPEEAWADMKAASDARDIATFREVRLNTQLMKASTDSLQGDPGLLQGRP